MLKKLSFYRKISSTILFVVFILLVIITRYDTLISQKIPVDIFLKLDSFSVINTFISSRSVDITILLIALIVPITTFIFGKYFCSWVCPLGYINKLISRIRFSKKSIPFKQTNYFKYYFSVFLVLISIAGFQVAGIFGPISIMTRSITLSILPFVNHSLNKLLDLVYLTSSVKFLYEPFKEFYDFIFAQETFNFDYIHITTILLLIILGLNIIENRFWCNKICPFGAMLGFIARFSLFKVNQNENICSKCSLCSKNCHGSATPDQPGELKYSECMVCGNCLDQCPKGLLKYQPVFNTINSTFNPDRRLFITSGLASLPLICLLYYPKNEQVAHLRPPCAIEEQEFIDKCIRCGACVKVCPNNALQLTLFETGYYGIYTPILIPRTGYCEYTCNLCTTVCPTDAIISTTVEKKQLISIGKAKINKSLCIPYAYNTTCLVCEEHCPVPGKAIKVIDKDNIGKPVVDNNMCIGCGICEYKCPVQPKGAISVYPLLLSKNYQQVV